MLKKTVGLTRKHANNLNVKAQGLAKAKCTAMLWKNSGMIKIDTVKKNLQKTSSTLRLKKTKG